MESQKTIAVTLRRSGIGKPRKQRDTLRSLGLTRLNKTVLVHDTPEIRGMLTRVLHLIEVKRV